jgi:iron(III) transport system permease protein
LLAGMLIAFLQAMTLFGSPAILALPAGFHTMTTKIWSLFQFPPKPELAAAASLPLLVLTVLLLRAQHMILGRKGYSVVGGKTGDPRLIRLGIWKGPAVVFVFGVLMLPVFLPYFALFNAAFAPIATTLVTPESATLSNVWFTFASGRRTRTRPRAGPAPCGRRALAARGQGRLPLPRRYGRARDHHRRPPRRRRASWGRLA